MKLSLTTSKLLALIASHLATGSSAACGPDATGKFVVPGLFYPNRKVSCADAKKYPIWRCEHPKFQMNCPTTCCAYLNEGCEDGKTLVFIEDSGRPNKKRGCAWVGRKNTNQRCSYAVIQALCPSTCGLCPMPSETPSLIPSETPSSSSMPSEIQYLPIPNKAVLDASVDIYCTNAIDWDNHADYALYGPIEGWNVSLINDMSNVFNNESSCNPDISDWDVSNVVTFTSMFYYASSFNSDLSSWDVSSATDFISMFQDAMAFDGDLSSWDVSSATSFSTMFYGAASFNGDLSSWDVSNAADFGHMFDGAASFNQALSSWIVSSATSFHHMFSGAVFFNGDISSWDVSGVTSFEAMFYGATSFNQNIIDSWIVSSATNFEYMFYGATLFDQDLCNWSTNLVSASTTDICANGAMCGTWPACL
jgi:surface protein